MDNQRYKILLAENRDRQRWDSYVAAHPGASPYHLFAWKKAIEEAYGHKSYYLLAEEKEKIVGIFPLIHFHLPPFLNELNSLPFCDVGNLLCENTEVGRLLLEESLRLGRKKKIRRMSLRGKVDLPSSWNDVLFPKSHDKVRMFLALPDSSEKLLKGFKSKLRSQIRKAEKNGLDFSWGTLKDIDSYYAVFSKNMRDLGSPVHSKKWFQCILNHFGANARMGIVRSEDQPVGGCILLSVGRKIAIPWASTLRQYNRLAPNMLLYWNALKYSADAGFTTFDFGRSSTGEGTFKFKKQWGAEPVPLVWYTNRPAQGSASSEDAGAGKREKIATVWSTFPVPLANFLGPRIRKYISL